MSPYCSLFFLNEFFIISAVYVILKYFIVKCIKTLNRYISAEITISFATATYEHKFLLIFNGFTIINDLLSFFCVLTVPVPCLQKHSVIFTTVGKIIVSWQSCNMKLIFMLTRFPVVGNLICISSYSFFLALTCAIFLESCRSSFLLWKKKPLVVKYLHRPQIYTIKVSENYLKNTI